jgi:hypothetical protein
MRGVFIALTWPVCAVACTLSLLLPHGTPAVSDQLQRAVLLVPL